MFDPLPRLNAAVKRASLPLVTSLLVFHVGCTDVTGPVLLPTDLCAGQPDIAVVTFEDVQLEAAVKNELSLGVQDDVTCRLASTLPSLEANFSGIARLTGIQNLTSADELLLAGNFITDLSPLSGSTVLAVLDLGENTITDISALSGLTNLGALNLRKNSINDISALSGLTSLLLLGLDSNSITDIGALSRLTSLESLILFNNSITDISVLSGFNSLIILDLGENPIADISALSSHLFLETIGLDNTDITDISVLRNLEDLSTISLNGNTRLTDIQPLLDHPTLGPGVTVYLLDTRVSCDDIAALVAKKVTVISNC